jgi:hypothetical protein
LADQQYPPFLAASSLLKKDLFILSIDANVLALGAVADFGAQNCQYTTKVYER